MIQAPLLSIERWFVEFAQCSQKYLIICWSWFNKSFESDKKEFLRIDCLASNKLSDRDIDISTISLNDVRTHFEVGSNPLRQSFQSWINSRVWKTQSVAVASVAYDDVMCIRVAASWVIPSDRRFFPLHRAQHTFLCLIPRGFIFTLYFCFYFLSKQLLFHWAPLRLF